MVEAGSGAQPQHRTKTPKGAPRAGRAAVRCGANQVLRAKASRQHDPVPCASRLVRLVPTLRIRGKTSEHDARAHKASRVDSHREAQATATSSRSLLKMSLGDEAHVEDGGAPAEELLPQDLLREFDGVNACGAHLSFARLLRRTNGN